MTVHVKLPRVSVPVLSNPIDVHPWSKSKTAAFFTRIFLIYKPMSQSRVWIMLVLTVKQIIRLDPISNSAFIVVAMEGKF